MAWLELEYGVDCLWSYVAQVHEARAPYTRCCLTITWVEEYGPQDVCFFICESWPQGLPVKKMEAARLLMLCKLQFDIHMYLHWGPEETNFLLPRERDTPPPYGGAVIPPAGRG
jgi:hypothetical protein